MREIAAYVDDLVSRLECDPLKRDEIRLEVHLHLRELVDAEMAAGADAEAAQEAAIRQFGSVEEVAARLAMVHDLAPIPPAAVHRPGVVIGWGLVVAPMVVAIGLFAPVAILPDYLIWTATTAWVVAVAALARWRGARRPLLVAGLAATVGFALWAAPWLMSSWFMLRHAPFSSAGLQAHAAELTVRGVILGYCTVIGFLLALTALLRWVLILLPRALPRVHPALAAAGLVLAALWAHPYLIPGKMLPQDISAEEAQRLSGGSKIPRDAPAEVLIWQERSVLAGMFPLSRSVAAVAALWLALLTARGLCSAGGTRRFVVCAGAIMLGATSIPAGIAVADLALGTTGLLSPGRTLLAGTVSYMLIMTAVAALLAALVWAADNSRLPWPTKLEARMGV